MITAVTMLLLAQAQPEWLALALRDKESIPTASAPKWAARADGVETAEIDATLAGVHVDRIHLVRVEPAKVRFTVRNDARKPRTVEEWRDELGAIAVVNGSYYALDGTPDTPLRSEGARLGPKR